MYPVSCHFVAFHKRIGIDPKGALRQISCMTTPTLSYVIRTTVLIGICAVLAACQTVPSSQADRDKLDTNVDFAIKKSIEKDPGLKHWYDSSYGYVVFPTVGKGGMGFGGAFGRGEVYEEKKHVGYAAIVEGSWGLQLGGQAFTEIIFFQDQEAFDRFTKGSFELGAQASAVAVTVGAAAKGQFTNGVAVFILPQGGLMYESSIGGQKFNYAPLSDVSE